jgi:hypothetical protein
VANCRTCSAPIDWARTENGKAIPLDLAPVTGGNIELDSFGVARVVRPSQALRRISHFVTCVGAAKHRKAGR